MKFFTNILILLIICISATILPVNFSFYTVNLKIVDINPFKKELVEVTATPTSYDTNVSGLLYNPSQIEFTMFSNFDKAPFKIGQDHDVILKVYDYNNSIISTYKNLEFISEIVTDKNVNSELSYILNISKDNLNLALGEYHFKINSTSSMFKDLEPVEFSVSYMENIDYQTKLLRPLEDKEELFTLYYPDNTLEYQIPVTRIVKQESNLYRGLINSLQNPPKHPLIYSKSPIPNVSKIWLQKKNNRMFVHLPNNIGEFNNDKVLGDLALNTYLQNLKNFNVATVQFLKGERYVKKYLAGNELKDPISLTSYPRYYMAKKTPDNNVLFIPKSIQTTFEIKIDYVDYIILSLQSKQPDGFIKIIPDYIELNSAIIKNNTLVVDFSETFTSSFNGDENLQKLMFDSMLYSFTTIPGIDNVKFNIDGKEDITFCSMDLSNPIEAPTYINVID